jgi:hypothetical protein
VAGDALDQVGECLACSFGTQRREGRTRDAHRDLLDFIKRDVVRGQGGCEIIDKARIEPASIAPARQDRICQDGVVGPLAACRSHDRLS